MDKGKLVYYKTVSFLFPFHYIRQMRLQPNLVTNVSQRGTSLSSRIKARRPEIERILEARIQEEHGLPNNNHGLTSEKARLAWEELLHAAPWLEHADINAATRLCNKWSLFYNISQYISSMLPCFDLKIARKVSTEASGFFTVCESICNDARTLGLQSSHWLKRFNDNVGRKKELALELDPLPVSPLFLDEDEQTMWNETYASFKNILRRRDSLTLMVWLKSTRLERQVDSNLEIIYSDENLRDKRAQSSLGSASYQLRKISQLFEKVIGLTSDGRRQVIRDMIAFERQIGVGISEEEKATGYFIQKARDRKTR